MLATKKQLIRDEFSHIKSLYFNSAYFGPSPWRAKERVGKALARELDPSFYAYNTWMEIPENIRKKLAKMLACSPDHIAHATSVSDIVNMIANGHAFSPGDIVCSIQGEYPSNILPWMLAQKNYGIHLELLKSAMPTAEWLRESLPPQTKVFNISHVAFDSGRKVDLVAIGQLMQERDILFVVDGTQSLGGLAISPEELQYIDVFCCSTYKWMLGPYGTAFGYFSPKALNRIKHKSGNWITSPKSKVVYSLLDYTTDTLPGARKFDRGQAPNMLSMACLESSLDFFDEIGLSEVAKHNQELRDYFLSLFPKKKYEIITPLEGLSNIISLKAQDKDPTLLEKNLREENIDVSVREGKIRLSFHIFNTREQVEILVKTLS